MYFEQIGSPKKRVPESIVEKGCKFFVKSKDTPHPLISKIARTFNGRFIK